LPCSYNIWVHLLGAFKEACYWAHRWHPYSLHVWRYSYWTLGINVGNLWEPSLCHHKVCVLDFGSEFLSLVHVQLLKDVAVKSRRNFFVSSGIISNWSCMWGLFWRWQVIASIFLKIPICTTSHWLIYSRPSLSSFTFSQQGLDCVSLH
jgi:hypothetical protein